MPGLLYDVVPLLQVLVVEFWRGPARTCPHRCPTFGGVCMLERGALPARDSGGGAGGGGKGEGGGVRGVGRGEGGEGGEEGEEGEKNGGGDTATATTNTPGPTDTAGTPGSTTSSRAAMFVLPFRLGAVTADGKVPYVGVCLRLLWQPSMEKAEKKAVKWIAPDAEDWGLFGDDSDDSSD